MRGLIYSILLIGCLVQTTANAQQIKVSSGFVEDSTQLGDPVKFYLTARYPQTLNALFPDSTFAFTPFEYQGKKFFPTHTTGGISYDSAVYYLSTFEIDKIQYLSLPVFVTTAKDCTTYAALPDSIRLIELIKTPPPDSVNAQNLPLKSNTLYEKVFTEWNYIILVIALIALLVAAIIIWIVFGKKIIRNFKRRRMSKAHAKFMLAYADLLSDIRKEFSREKTEQALSLWKKYLEQLENRPYTKLTTLEITRLYPAENLETPLGLIDRGIYGNNPSVLSALHELLSFTEKQFNNKLKETT